MHVNLFQLNLANRKIFILYDYRIKEKQKKTQAANGRFVNLAAIF